jgi:hypothetical protein
VGATAHQQSNIEQTLLKIKLELSIRNAAVTFSISASAAI